MAFPYITEKQTINSVTKIVKKKQAEGVLPSGSGPAFEPIKTQADIDSVSISENVGKIYQFTASTVDSDIIKSDDIYNVTVDNSKLFNKNNQQLENLKFVYFNNTWNKSSINNYYNIKKFGGSELWTTAIMFEHQLPFDFEIQYTGRYNTAVLVEKSKYKMYINTSFGWSEAADMIPNSDYIAYYGIEVFSMKWLVKDAESMSDRIYATASLSNKAILVGSGQFTGNDDVAAGYLSFYKGGYIDPVTYQTIGTPQMVSYDLNDIKIEKYDLNNNLLDLNIIETLNPINLNDYGISVTGTIDNGSNFTVSLKNKEFEPEMKQFELYSVTALNQTEAVKLEEGCEVKGINFDKNYNVQASTIAEELGYTLTETESIYSGFAYMVPLIAVEGNTESNLQINSINWDFLDEAISYYGGGDKFYFRAIWNSDLNKLQWNITCNGNTLIPSAMEVREVEFSQWQIDLQGTPAAGDNFILDLTNRTFKINKRLDSCISLYIYNGYTVMQSIVKDNNNLTDFCFIDVSTKQSLNKGFPPSWIYFGRSWQAYSWLDININTTGKLVYLTDNKIKEMATTEKLVSGYRLISLNNN